MGIPCGENRTNMDYSTLKRWTAETAIFIPINCETAHDITLDILILFDQF